MNESFSDLNDKNKQDLENITKEIFNLLTPENQKELMGLINDNSASSSLIGGKIEELSKIDRDKILRKLKRKEYMREYRQRPEVKERKIEYQKEYRQIPKNKERKREYHREYYQNPENKKRIRKYQKEYYKKPENKERKREYQRKYYHKNQFKQIYNQLQREFNQIKKHNKF